jgi:hypothetical protein
MIEPDREHPDEERGPDELFVSKEEADAANMPAFRRDPPQRKTYDQLFQEVGAKASAVKAPAEEPEEEEAEAPLPLPAPGKTIEHDAHRSYEGRSVGSTGVSSAPEKVNCAPEGEPACSSHSVRLSLSA